MDYEGERGRTCAPQAYGVYPWRLGIPKEGDISWMGDHGPRLRVGHLYAFHFFQRSQGVAQTYVDGEVGSWLLVREGFGKGW